MKIARATTFLTATALSALLLSAVPAFADDDHTMSPIYSKGDPAPPAKSAMGHHKMDSAEGRIQHLHDQLKITPDQESMWANVASVMQENSTAMESAIQDRVQKTRTMTATDDINSYAAMTQAHADGLKKLANAFAPLYAAMTPDQQKNADAVFGHHAEEEMMHRHHHPKQG